MCTFPQTDRTHTPTHTHTSVHRRHSVHTLEDWLYLFLWTLLQPCTQPCTRPRSNIPFPLFLASITRRVTAQNRCELLPFPLPYISPPTCPPIHIFWIIPRWGLFCTGLISILDACASANDHLNSHCQYIHFYIGARDRREWVVGAGMNYCRELRMNPRCRGKLQRHYSHTHSLTHYLM